MITAKIALLGTAIAAAALSLAAIPANATTLLVKDIGVMNTTEANITVGGNTEQIYNSPQVFTLTDGKVLDLVNCVLPAGINYVGGQNPVLTYTSELGATYFSGREEVGEQIQYLINLEKGASSTMLDDITTAINIKLGGVTYNSPVDSIAQDLAASTKATAYIGAVYTSSDPNGQAVMFGGGVPEPATWAVMLLGFGSIGAAMRSKRRKLAFAAA